MDKKLFLCAFWLAAGIFCAAVVRASSNGCSSCPLTYAPVVDADTGLPFYNECVAKCQLGTGVNLVPAGSRRAAAAGRSASASSQPDFLKLVPAPNGTNAGIEVNAETILRFSNDGYKYVGRPGLIDMPAEGVKPAPSENVKKATNSAAEARANNNNNNNNGSQGSATNGPTVTLLVAYPQGDLYMKVWNQSELKALVKNHTGPKSETAQLSRATVPQATKNDGTTLPARRLLGSVIYGSDDRREVTSLAYPYTAVSFTSTGCTAAMVGATGRLALTAAQCVYNNGVNPSAPVGFYSNIIIAPGMYRGISSYGTHPVGLLQVLTTWSSQGLWEGNIALMQLSYHYKACGSLAYGYRCGLSGYTLNTAGYPADKSLYTMWTQTATVATDVCSGSAEKVFPFDAADGQVGSPFWTTSDNAVRFVLSRGMCCSGNGAVAITPSFYSIMTDFTTNYILTTPIYILVGGPSRNQFVRCDTSSWVCTGTTSRTSATRFYGHPVASTTKAAFRVPGTSLCLSLRSTTSTGNVNLYSCDTTAFNFYTNELWNIGRYNNIPVLLTDNGGFMSWGGSGVQMKTSPSCSSLTAGSCTWQVEAP
ncbi:hypothetical protein VaNZ11_008723 [Volvox africanus]|uniref:Serine protease n=1 Tax=Volvox africanus TaxID=51714 RepID=A0ABQ5S5Q9_9CHLO|nr:hypothetical protein VaNZ11_008723 [Volvox africanus]